MRRLVFTLLLLISILMPASAIGVTPAKTYVDFVPNTTIVGACVSITDPGCICVRAEGSENLTFTSGGDLSGTVNKTTFRFVKSQNPFNCYSYNITFPSLAKKSGENVIKIIVTGAPPTGGPIAITLTVDQKIKVAVPEKYTAPYVPPPLDISKLLIYGSISLMVISVLLFLLYKK